MSVIAPLNRHLCVAVFCCFSMVSAPVLAATPVEQRVQRLERILDNRVLIDLLQRIEGLQREMRELRGEIELQRNDLVKMEQRNRDLYIDTDRRLQDIENRDSASAAQPRDSAGASGAVASAAAASAAIASAADAAAPEDTTASALRVQPAVPSAAATNAITGAVAGAAAPTASALLDQPPQASPEEKALFDSAYLDLVNGRYSAATAGFDKLLGQYPNSQYAPGSLYWMGEAQYAQRQFDQARVYFDQLLVLYPTDKKAPDARLKVGFVEHELGDVDAAKATLEGVVNRHPRTTAALLAQRRLQQMGE